MADAAVEFLLSNLKEVVEHHAHLIRHAKGNIANLERDLEVFKAFLKDTAKMRKNDEQIKLMWKEIHDVVYEVEDVIDFYVLKANEESQQNTLMRLVKGRTKFLHSVGRKVEAISKRVQDMREAITSVHKDEKGIHEKPQVLLLL